VIEVRKGSSMNAKQARLACIVAVAIVFMILFPPYDIYMFSYPGAEYYHDFGYGFIGRMPEKGAVHARINTPALCIQIACFLVVGGMLWFEFRKH